MKTAKLPAIPKRARYHVYGKRWFDSVNGNTYHSVVVTKNDVELFKVPFAYGYEYQFEQTAIEELRKLFSKVPDNVYNVFGMQRNGFKMLSTAIDVPRKKDL